MPKTRHKTVLDMIYMVAGVGMVYASYRCITTWLDSIALQTGYSLNASEFWAFIIGAIGLSYAAVALAVHAIGSWKTNRRLALSFWLIVAVLEVIIVFMPIMVYNEGIQNIARFAKYGLKSELAIRECWIAVSVHCGVIAGHVQAIILTWPSRRKL